MITFTGNTICIEETGETCKVTTVRVLDFIKKIVDNEARGAVKDTSRGYDKGFRDGIRKATKRVEMAMKGL